MSLKEQMNIMVAQAIVERNYEMEEWQRKQEKFIEAEQKKVDEVVNKIPNAAYKAVKEMKEFIPVCDVPRSEYETYVGWGSGGGQQKNCARLRHASLSSKIWHRLVNEGLNPEILYTEKSNTEDALNHYLEVKCAIVLKNPNYRKPVFNI